MVELARSGRRHRASAGANPFLGAGPQQRGGSHLADLTSGFGNCDRTRIPCPLCGISAFRHGRAVAPAIPTVRKYHVTVVAVGEDLVRLAAVESNQAIFP